MISLPFLWQWLFTNFTPLQEGEENGIDKNEVVNELLCTKEVNKEGNPHAAAFAKALISRYLCVLFKTSDRCKDKFTDPSQPTQYTLKRLTGEEKLVRESDVPAFPQDLRALILKELRDERLGRSSANSLVRLMSSPQQPPKKKSRTSLDNSGGLSASQSEKGQPVDAAGEGADLSELSPPMSPSGRRGLKRSAPGGEESPKEGTPGRSLKRQTSSTKGTGPQFPQQEPWKREINDLWAKQLAMMREINTLKVELGRREAARQREILAMRQELDVMRGEIFRLRQLTGAGPAPGPLEADTENTQERKEEGGEEMVTEESLVEAQRTVEGNEADKVVAGGDVAHAVASTEEI